MPAFLEFLRRAFDPCVFFLVWLGTILRHPKVAARYTRNTGRVPNAALPSTIEDRFFWRKCFDRDPRFPIIADKLAVRDWIAQQGFDLEAPEIHWSGTNANDIPDHLRTSEYVLKANHGSGWNVFFKDHQAKPQRAIEIGNSYLHQEYGRRWYEPFYFDISPRLFVETFLREAVMEMKFYTFGDHITRVYVRYERLNSDKAIADIWLVDADGELYLADVKAGKSDGRAGRPIPPVAPRALEIARDIGSHFDHVRVDLLSDGQRLWLGELTLTNDGGQSSGMDPDGVRLFNASWDLRGSWFLTTPQTGWRKVYANALLRRLNAPSTSARSAGSAPAPRLYPRD